MQIKSVRCIACLWYLFSTFSLYALDRLGQDVFSKAASQDSESEKTVSDRTTQSSSIRHSEINFGVIFFTSVSADTVYSYLYKTPLAGGVDLGYTYKTKNMRHGISIRGGAGRLYSPYRSIGDYPALDDMAFQFSFRHISVFRIWYNNALTLFLGPGVQFSGNGWIPDNEVWDVLRYAWSLHTGTGLAFYLQWDIKPKHQLHFSLYTPFLGAAWRPEYSGYTLREESILEAEGIMAALFANEDFISFHNFISIDLRLAYKYSINSLIVLYVEYYALIEYITLPRVRLELQNNVIMGLSFQF